MEKTTMEKHLEKLDPETADRIRQQMRKEKNMRALATDVFQACKEQGLTIEEYSMFCHYLQSTLGCMEKDCRKKTKVFTPEC